jgi:hypothetical protein
MADATVSKTVEGNLVWVRLPPSAPFPNQKNAALVQTTNAAFWLFHTLFCTLSTETA